MKIFPVLMLFLLPASVALACEKHHSASSSPSTAHSSGMDKEQKTADPLDEAKAKRLALEEARRQGRDPARHNVVVRDKGNEWEVELTGPEPRTPGDGMTVYVDKNTGALRVMLNE